jgi:transcriptional regulator with XRE-family HTH domain
MPRRDNTEDAKVVIAFLRLLRGWTQTELAEAAGLSTSAISRYENGDIVPSREALEEIAVAAGLPLRMLDRVFIWVGASRAAVMSGADPYDPDRLADAVVSELAGGLVDLLDSVTAGMLADFPDADVGPWIRPVEPPCVEDRELAVELWESLKRREPPVRRVLVEDSRRFQHWALCELLCAESVRAVAGSVDQALELAELALLAAERMLGEETWRQRLQGYVWAHIATLRMRGNLPGAEEALARATELWEAGAPGDPGLLKEVWRI